jgi:hypothetical protein
VDICLFVVADMPARLRQQAVNIFSSHGLWGGGRQSATCALLPAQ